MTPRRIVMAMIEPPLPFGSAAARWYYVLLKGLVERGHRVTAFAACSKPEEIEKTAMLLTAQAAQRVRPIRDVNEADLREVVSRLPAAATAKAPPDTSKPNRAVPVHRVK